MVGVPVAGANQCTPWLPLTVFNGRMSHPDQIMFFEISGRYFPEFFTESRVLEVGSLDINGSIRQVMNSGVDYVGIDVGAGPGVDVVVRGEDFDAPAGSFDMVLSGECMEHNPAWEETTRNILRVLRPGGLFLLSCAAPGRPEHGTARTSPGSSPLTVALGSEYYENLDFGDFERSSALAPLSPVAHWMNWRTRDLYIAGFKGSPAQPAWESYLDAVGNWIDEIHSLKAIPRLESVVLSRLGRTSYERLLPLIRRLRRVRDKIRQPLGRLRRGDRK